MASERAVRARLQRAGQEHLLRFCAELEPGPRAALLAELAPLEPEALREHCLRAAAAWARPPGPPPDLAARLRPLPPERLGSAVRSDPDTRRRWEEEGSAGRPGRREGRLCAARGLSVTSGSRLPLTPTSSPPRAVCIAHRAGQCPAQGRPGRRAPLAHSHTPSLHAHIGAGAFLASWPRREAGVGGESPAQPHPAPRPPTAGGRG